MSDRDNRLRETNMAFFGAVTASLSHELNNVYTIINELSGLLEDYLIGAEQGVPLKPDKLKGIVERIGNQIERGKILVKRLNSFAHSSDEAVATISLRELLERMVEITRRFATLKKAELESDFPEDDTELTTNPFMLQQAVFICVKMALGAVDEKRVVGVSYETPESGAVVSINSADPVTLPDDGSDERSVLSMLMTELGGTVEFLPGPEGDFSFKLKLPRALPQ